MFENIKCCSCHFQICLLWLNATYAYAYYTHIFYVCVYVNACTCVLIYTHICEYIRAYIHVYGSLLCIPTSFLIRSIVCQTKDISRNDKAKLNLPINESYHFSSFRSRRKFTDKRLFFNPCSIFSYQKWEENVNSRFNSLFYHANFMFFKKRSVFQPVSASRLRNV